MFCAGGVDKENPLNPKDNRENGVMVFFRDSLGPILNKAWFKAIIILVTTELCSKVIIGRIIHFISYILHVRDKFALKANGPIYGPVMLSAVRLVISAQFGPPPSHKKCHW